MRVFGACGIVACGAVGLVEKGCGIPVCQGLPETCAKPQIFMNNMMFLFAQSHMNNSLEPFFIPQRNGGREISSTQPTNEHTEISHALFFQDNRLCGGRYKYGCHRVDTCIYMHIFMLVGNLWRHRPPASLFWQTEVAVDMKLFLCFGWIARFGDRAICSLVADVSQGL